MIEALASRAPWYVVAVALGLVVVAALMTVNERIGAVGGHIEVVDRWSGRSAALGRRGWFHLGIVAGIGLHVLPGGRNGAAAAIPAASAAV